MARYILKQKALTLVDTFMVQDQWGRDVLQVEGEIAFIPTLRILDLYGNVLAEMRRSFDSLCYTYEVYRNGQVLATVKKVFFSLLGPRYDIRIANGQEVIAEGDFFGWDYNLTWRGLRIGEIRQQCAIPDAYAVDVTDGHDPIPILAIAVIIDLTHHHRSFTTSLLLGR